MAEEVKLEIVKEKVVVPLDDLIKKYVSQTPYLEIGDSKYLKKLYNKTLKLIRSTIELDMSVNVTVQMDFWLSYVILAMNTVELLVRDGNKRRELVLMNLKIIMERDIDMAEDKKDLLIKNFEQFAPLLIDTLIKGSRSLTINIKKYCCCR
tara:strand:- start:1670 stop:2122 length:453 start_codon:yes stop_codon:yes gene_type:complete